MLVNPSSNQVKLIDFGLARKYNPNETMQALCGTPEFVGTLMVVVFGVLDHDLLIDHGILSHLGSVHTNAFSYENGYI